MRKRVVFWIFLFLLLSLGMQLAVRYWIESDPNTPALKSWLLSQHEVISLVGNNASPHIKNLVTVDATSSQPGYSRYVVILSGKDSKARVVVTMSEDGDGFRIDSIKPL